MPWTYQQRIQRVSHTLVDKNLLDISQINHLKRPLYFGQYAFSLGFSPNALNWSRFDELKDQIIEGLQGRDYHLTANHSTMDYHLFSNDVGVIRWVITHNGPFVLSHLRIIDKESWHLPRARNKKKTKFYGLYSWRVMIKDPKWLDNPKNQKFLDELSGNWKTSVPPQFYHEPKTYLYLDNKNDVLLIKLMAAEQILNIEDRSAL